MGVLRADRRRGRHQGQEQARRDRRAVVVAAVYRRARFLRDEQPAAAGALLRPPGPGHRVQTGHGQGHRPGPGLAAPAVQRIDHRAAADRRPVAGGRVAAGRSGAVPCPAAGRRDAARDRAGLLRLRDTAVPRVLSRPVDELQLPGLGHAVQAPGRGLLRAGRGVRRGSFRDARLARQGPGRAARRAARQGSEHRRSRPRPVRRRGRPRRGDQPRPGGPVRGDRPAPCGLPGGLLVSRPEPGPAAPPAAKPGRPARPAAAPV